MNAEQKKTIKSTILECREILEKDIEQVLINYGIYINKGWVNLRDLKNLTEEQENNRKNIEKAIEKLEKGGFEKDKAVMEYIKEVSYTYLNRLAALRVMEVRGLIDEILVPRGEHGNRSFIGSRFYEVAREFCKYEMDGGLGYLLNIMFEEISEEIRMLFNTEDEYSFVTPSSTSLLKVIELLCTNIDEETWRQDEIIGWIYQYFNEKEKEDVFDRLYNKKQKIKVEDIPAATQLFTPDWIVDWIVDNSLGSLWNEIKQGKREDKKVEDVKLLDPCCGSGHFLVKAYDLFYDMYVEEGIYTKEEIPYKILEKNIYGIDIDLRAVQLTGLILFIKTKTYLKENSYDINTKDKLSVNLVCADSILLNGSRLEDLKEKHKNNKTILKMIEIIYEEFEDVRLKGSLIQPEKKLFPLFEEFKNRIAKKELSKAKRTKRKQTKGQETLLNEQSISLSDYKSQRDFTKEERELMSSLDAIYSEAIKANDISRQLFANEAKKSVKLVDIFMKQYDVVVTNPPYMGKRSMNDKLKNYLRLEYKGYDNDLYSVFIKRCVDFIKENGFLGMITQHTFMFLPSFKDLRMFLLSQLFLKDIVHLGTNAFDDIGGEKVNTVMFIGKRNLEINDEGSKFVRLVKYNSSSAKKENLLNKSNQFIKKQEDFVVIDGAPFCYWISDNILSIFKNESKLNSIIYDKTDGNKTASNSKYIRYHWEIENKNDYRICSQVAKQEEFYANYDSIVRWDEDALSFYSSNKSSSLLKKELWDKESITWSRIGSSGFTPRYLDRGYIPDVSGPAIYLNENIYYILGFLNTNLAKYCISLLNPTLNFSVGDVLKLPIKIEKGKCEYIESKVKEIIGLKRKEISCDETSLLYRTHCLSEFVQIDLEESFIEYKKTYFNNYLEIVKRMNEIEDYFSNLFKLTKYDRMLIDNEINDFSNYILEDLSDDKYDALEDLYLNGVKCKTKTGERYKKIDMREISKIIDLPIEECVSYLNEKQIYSKDELKDCVINILSHYIGCIFGRWGSSQKYIKSDGIVPIDSSIYLEEDMVEQLYNCMALEYGESQVDSIYEQIEKILNKSIEEFIKSEFFNIHKKYYQKRPLYWHICSPKKTFNCFIYYHKLDNDTLYKVKSIYLNQMISRYEEDLKYYTNQLIEARTNGDKSKEKDFKDKCSDLEAKLEDLNILDKKIMEILPYKPNIDEGVLSNIIPIEPILSAPVATKRERDKYYEEVGK